jgi:hypothetical protein
MLFLCLCVLLTACGSRGAQSETALPPEAPPVIWECGSIGSKNGKDRNVELGTSLRTVGYLELACFAGVLPDTDYAISWFAYDSQQKYLGGCVSTLGNGVGISARQILEEYSETVYIRILVRSAYTEGKVDIAAGAPVRIYTAREGWPGLPMRQEAVADLSAIQGAYLQDGEAFGDVLFTFKADGTGNAYNIHTGEFLDGFSLGGKDKVAPHVNSASFSDQYYKEGDEYPLLYTSMYNNVTALNKYLLGTCCVYRITELGGQFDAQLVQIIRLGFVADRELWLSPKENSRPYGNFVVDTDRDLLYAFVPRDDSQTTRFFAFALPEPKAGTRSEKFGCNQVILEQKDIMRRFDVGYFSSPQGCCYADGKIYSVEGFGSYNMVPPFLRVVDVESGLQTHSINLGQLGLDREPEVITMLDGQLYYINADMVLRKLSFPWT